MLQVWWWLFGNGFVQGDVIMIFHHDYYKSQNTFYNSNKLLQATQYYFKTCTMFSLASMYCDSLNEQS